jgi:cytosine/uracil/thiamine/allantoin permease
LLGILFVYLLPTAGLSPTALRAARSAAKIFFALVCAASIWSGLFATLVRAVTLSSKHAPSPRPGELSLSCVSRC